MSYDNTSLTYFFFYSQHIEYAPEDYSFVEGTVTLGAPPLQTSEMVFPSVTVSRQPFTFPWRTGVELRCIWAPRALRLPSCLQRTFSCRAHLLPLELSVTFVFSMLILSVDTT